MKHKPSVSINSDIMHIISSQELPAMTLKIPKKCSSSSKEMVQIEVDYQVAPSISPKATHVDAHVKSKIKHYLNEDQLSMKHKPSISIDNDIKL